MFPKPFVSWSGRQDLNLRHLDPQSSALPSCATARSFGKSNYSTQNIECQANRGANLSLLCNTVPGITNKKEQSVIFLSFRYNLLLFKTVPNWSTVNSKRVMKSPNEANLATLSRFMKSASIELRSS